MTAVPAGSVRAGGTNCPLYRGNLTTLSDPPTCYPPNRYPPNRYPPSPSQPSPAPTNPAPTNHSGQSSSLNTIPNCRRIWSTTRMVAIESASGRNGDSNAPDEMQRATSAASKYSASWEICGSE